MPVMRIGNFCDASTLVAACSATRASCTAMRSLSVGSPEADRGASGSASASSRGVLAICSRRSRTSSASARFWSSILWRRSRMARNSPDCCAGTVAAVKRMSATAPAMLRTVLTTRLPRSIDETLNPPAYFRRRARLGKIRIGAERERPRCRVRNPLLRSRPRSGSRRAGDRSRTKRMRSKPLSRGMSRSVTIAAISAPLSMSSRRIESGTEHLDRATAASASSSAVAGASSTSRIAPDVLAAMAAPTEESDNRRRVRW